MRFPTFRRAWVVDQSVGVFYFMLQHHPVLISHNNTDNGKIKVLSYEFPPLLNQLYDAFSIFLHSLPPNRGFHGREKNDRLVLHFLERGLSHAFAIEKNAQHQRGHGQADDDQRCLKSYVIYKPCSRTHTFMSSESILYLPTVPDSL